MQKTVGYNEELHSVYFSPYPIPRIEEEEKTGECRVHGGDEKLVQSFGWET